MRGWLLALLLATAAWDGVPKCNNEGEDENTYANENDYACDGKCNSTNANAASVGTTLGLFALVGYRIRKGRR